jgi:hypothetical protein
VQKLKRLHKLLNDNHVFDLNLLGLGSFKQINKDFLSKLLYDTTQMKNFDEYKLFMNDLHHKLIEWQKQGIFEFKDIKFENYEWRNNERVFTGFTTVKVDQMWYFDGVDSNITYFLDNKITDFKFKDSIKLKSERLLKTARQGMYFVAYHGYSGNIIKRFAKQIIKAGVNEIIIFCRKADDNNDKYFDNYDTNDVKFCPVKRQFHNTIWKVKFDVQKLNEYFSPQYEVKKGHIEKVQNTENFATFINYSFERIDELQQNEQYPQKIANRKTKIKPIKPQTNKDLMKQETALIKYVAPISEAEIEVKETLQLSESLHVDQAGVLKIKTTGKKVDRQTAKYKPALKPEFVRLCKKHKLDVYSTLGKLYAVSNILNFEKIKLSVDSESNIYNDLLNSIVLEQDVTSPELIYEFLEQITEFVIDVDVTAFTSNNLDKLTNLMIRYNILCHFNPILQKQFTSRKFLSKHKINQNEVEEVMQITLDTIAYQSNYYFV